MGQFYVDLTTTETVKKTVHLMVVADTVEEVYELVGNYPNMNLDREDNPVKQMICVQQEIVDVNVEDVSVKNVNPKRKA